jgi:hypothetical protein
VKIKKANERAAPHRLLHTKISDVKAEIMKWMFGQAVLLLAALYGPIQAPDERSYFLTREVIPSYVSNKAR